MEGIIAVLCVYAFGFVMGMWAGWAGRTKKLDRDQIKARQIEIQKVKEEGGQ